MVGDEPVNLREWRAPTTAGDAGRLFTCGRPGRATFRREGRPIDDDTIDLWVKGLPKTELLDIVSLLGEKTDGYSEFGYYPFRSSKEAGNKPTFQQWLATIDALSCTSFQRWTRRESRQMLGKR